MLTIFLDIVQAQTIFRFPEIIYKWKNVQNQIRGSIFDHEKNQGRYTTKECIRINPLSDIYQK